MHQADEIKVGHQIARVGDSIECQVQSPQPSVIRMRLLTPDSCAHASDLLKDRTSGWSLVQQFQKQRGKNT